MRLGQKVIALESARENEIFELLASLESLEIKSLMTPTMVAVENRPGRLFSNKRITISTEGFFEAIKKFFSKIIEVIKKFFSRIFGGSSSGGGSSSSSYNKNDDIKTKKEKLKAGADKAKEAQKELKEAEDKTKKLENKVPVEKEIESKLKTADSNTPPKEIVKGVLESKKEEIVEKIKDKSVPLDKIQKETKEKNVASAPAKVADLYTKLYEEKFNITEEVLGYVAKYYFLFADDPDAVFDNFQNNKFVADLKPVGNIMEMISNGYEILSAGTINYDKDKFKRSVDIFLDAAQRFNTFIFTALPSLHYKNDDGFVIVPGYYPCSVNLGTKDGYAYLVNRIDNPKDRNKMTRTLRNDLKNRLIYFIEDYKRIVDNLPNMKRRIDVLVDMMDQLDKMKKRLDETVEKLDKERDSLEQSHDYNSLPQEERAKISGAFNAFVATNASVSNMILAIVSTIDIIASANSMIVEIVNDKSKVISDIGHVLGNVADYL